MNEGQIQISEHDNETSSSPLMCCFYKSEAKERVMTLIKKNKTQVREMSLLLKEFTKK